MRVRCLKRFKDLVGGTMRNPDEVFEVTNDRFVEINSKGYGNLVEFVDEGASDEGAPEEEPKPKTTTRRRRTTTTKQE